MFSKNFSVLAGIYLICFTVFTKAQIGTGTQSNGPCSTCANEFNTTPAPIVSSNPQWSSWGAWSACSATCGTGTTYRTRLCNNGCSSCQCVGSSTETGTCSTGTTCGSTCSTCGTPVYSPPTGGCTTCGGYSPPACSTCGGSSGLSNSPQYPYYDPYRNGKRSAVFPFTLPA